MNTVVKPEARITAFRVKNKTCYLVEKGNIPITIVDFKFYQKISVVLISFSIFLIFPESPHEMELLCKSNYSNQICNVF